MMMDDEKLKRLLQQDMDMDVENILEEVNSDPNLQDVVAPESIHDRLFEQIREYEEQKASEQSEEEKELIRLGKIYKKKRNRRKYFVIAAAVICALAIGITSFGGAEKVFEELERVLDGKKQTVINNDNEGDNSFSEEIASEEEAYQKIEDEYGIWPVRMYYLPEGMEFVELVIEEEIQVAQVYYENPDGGVLIYRIVTNYRTGTVGTDVEDEILDEYDMKVSNVDIHVKKYKDTGDEAIRYRITFVYKDSQYSLFMRGFEETEIKKIVENLYFL